MNIVEQSKLSGRYYQSVQEAVKGRVWGKFSFKHGNLVYKIKYCIT